MSADWIDDERERRARGESRALTQDQHAAVNARYPGCTKEVCCECDEYTGRAGRGEDSIYLEDGTGPLCLECYRETEEGRAMRTASLVTEVAGEFVTLTGTPGELEPALRELLAAETKRQQINTLFGEEEAVDAR